MWLMQVRYATFAWLLNRMGGSQWRSSGGLGEGGKRRTRNQANVSLFFSNWATFVTDAPRGGIRPNHDLQFHTKVRTESYVDDAYDVRIDH